jgi:hypothetical protein
MAKANLFVFLLVAGIAVKNVYALDLHSALQKTQTCFKNRNCDALLGDAGRLLTRMRWRRLLLMPVTSKNFMILRQRSCRY